MTRIGVEAVPRFWHTQLLGSLPACSRFTVPHEPHPVSLLRPRHVTEVNMEPTTKPSSQCRGHVSTQLDDATETKLSAAQIGEAASFFRSFEEDRRRGKPFGILPPALTPRTLRDALDIAQSLWGDTPVAGWKAGACSEATMKKLGFLRVPYARLAQSHLVQSPATLSTASFWHCNNEAEVAFILGKAIPARPDVDTRPYHAEELMEHIDKALVVIESCNWPHPIPDEEWDGGQREIMLACIASGFHVHSLILGPEIDNWQDIDLRALPVQLVINGKRVSCGHEGEARIDPLQTFVGMVNHMSSRGIGLESGQIVSTGSALECAVTNNPGDIAVAEFAGIGNVQVTYQ